jgi:hypothetical protein
LLKKADSYQILFSDCYVPYDTLSELKWASVSSIYHQL